MFARHYSRRLLQLLPLAALLLFALGLVMQPVLAAAGEMHELAHDPSGMHSHATHASYSQAGAVDEQPPADEDSPALHLLLDFAHCCGSAVAMPPAMRALGAASLLEDAPVARDAVAPVAARLASVFKPPISG